MSQDKIDDLILEIRKKTVNNNQIIFFDLLRIIQADYVMTNFVKSYFGSNKDEILGKLSNIDNQKLAIQIVAANRVGKRNRYICAYCKHKTIFLPEPNTKLNKFKWENPEIFLNLSSNCKKNKYGHAYISWEYLEQLKLKRKGN